MERQACQETEKLVMSSKLNTVGLGGAFEKCRRTQRQGHRDSEEVQGAVSTHQMAIAMGERAQ